MKKVTELISLIAKSHKDRDGQISVSDIEVNQPEPVSEHSENDDILPKERVVTKSERLEQPRVELLPKDKQ